MKDVYKDADYMQNFKQHIVILGAGGFAKEIYWHMEKLHKHHFYFVDDVTDITELYGRKVIKDWGFASYFKFIVGVGDPMVKVKLVTKAIAAGIEPLPTFVHPTSTVHEDVKLGKGGIICPGATVTASAIVGDYVSVNINATIAHDCKVGDYSTFAPGCNISGNNTIGVGCSFGTGSTTREKISVVRGVVIGSSATVVKDITEPGTYVGVPSKKIK